MRVRRLVYDKCKWKPNLKFQALQLCESFAQFVYIIILLLNIITPLYNKEIWSAAETLLSDSEHTHTNEDPDLYSKEQSGGASDGPKSKISLVHSPQKYCPFIVHLIW